jgi:hypothetical protein
MENFPGMIEQHGRDNPSIYNLHCSETKDSPRNRAVQQTSLQVTMCRYSESGILIKAKLPIDATEYVAVSHVWGRDAEWRHIPGVKSDVFASKEKAKFLVERLPFIVENKWFWMDILCINQHDDEARIAITQHIPAIFRSAQRTVVIRGGAGLRDCCVKAYELLPGGECFDYSTARIHHRTIHKNIHFEENVLSRLWPLQEIMLSDSIQFVRCEDVVDEEITRP